MGLKRQQPNHLVARQLPQGWQADEIEGDYAADWVAWQPKHHHGLAAARGLDGCKCQGLARLHLDLHHQKALQLWHAALSKSLLSLSQASVSLTSSMELSHSA